MNKQLATQQILEALEQVALQAPDKLPMAIAETMSLLAMHGFSEAERSSIEQSINGIIDRYLGGALLDNTVIRHNGSLH